MPFYSCRYPQECYDLKWHSFILACSNRSIHNQYLLEASIVIKPTWSIVTSLPIKQLICSDEVLLTRRKSLHTSATCCSCWLQAFLNAFCTHGTEYPTMRALRLQQTACIYTMNPSEVFFWLKIAIFYFNCLPLLRFIFISNNASHLMSIFSDHVIILQTWSALSMTVVLFSKNRPMPSTCYQMNHWVLT